MSIEVECRANGVKYEGSSGLAELAGVAVNGQVERVCQVWPVMPPRGIHEFLDEVLEYKLLGNFRVMSLSALELCTLVPWQGASLGWFSLEN